MYHKCLQAPTYNVFSNTTSASSYQNKHKVAVCSLEAPHNSTHLAVGGYSAPKVVNEGVSGDMAGIVSGANGDMGENNTAASCPHAHTHTPPLAPVSSAHYHRLG